MSRQVCLGAYGERFGSPEFRIRLDDGKVDEIEVLRGAPCGATWAAASRLKGTACEAAAERIGLEVQFFCPADPSSWDPIHGKSPIHFAGEIHSAALKRALGRKS